MLIAVLESAINHYLALDEDVGQFLAPLVGKTIAVCVTPFNETVYLCPKPDGIQLLEAWQGSVDTTITGSLTALGLMGLSGKPMRSVFGGEVQIEGDTHTGRRLQTLFAELDVDLEEPLSRLTGDVIAHQIGNVFRAGRDWNRQALHTCKLNSEEFLQEETRDLPAKAEADIFFRQVDDLRADFDRLSARFDRLSNLPSTAD